MTITMIHLNQRHLILLCFIRKIKDKRKICEKENVSVVEDSTVDKPQMEVQENSLGEKQNIIHWFTVLCYMQFNECKLQFNKLFFCILLLD